MIRAVFFDFGGVITSSPFDAFASYEERSGLPEGFIRMVNSTNPDLNAWAQLERSEIGIDEFAARFEDEARELGHPVDARQVVACLAGEVRAPMVEAVRRCKARLRTALLTNNFLSADPGGVGAEELESLFDVIVESARIGVRKPDPTFYEIACDRAGVSPGEAVFLDDLGVNLKPARAMGMTTIKVADPTVALAELEAVVGFPLG